MSPGQSHGARATIEAPNAARDATLNSRNQLFGYSSNDDSQETTATHDSDRVFTPPGSDSGASSGPLHGNGNASSQESQLFQLSQLAAAQEKMAEGQSRKRMADGAVKHTRDSSSTSPVRMAGHSRNTSTVSVASTTGSRIGELSAELKAKLSYAMVKVNNGWQSHSIDEVESLASHAGSPTSSTSTVHGRNGIHASPRVSLAAARHGTQSAGISPIGHHPPQGRTYDSWRETNARPQHHSASPPATHVPMLAPPAAIQPGRSGYLNPRRNSNARYAPAYLAQQASPHTPAQPSPLQSTPGTAASRTPQVDPILFSPHQNVREQEALETLMFMSSPGNSANMKHNFSAGHHAPAGAQPQRTALPTSRLASSNQQRKTLPTIRHQAHGSIGKRVGFEMSPSNASEMDVDDHYGSPRGTPRRRTIGGSRPALSVPAGLNAPSRPRSQLQDADIERMLDRVAADESSDSEGEITLPRNQRPERPKVVGV